MRLLGFLLLLKIKYLSKVLYRFNLTWLSDHNPQQWQNIKLIIFLNHTSLFEPIFVATAPNKFLWHLSHHLIVPAADVTLNRPFAGRLLKTLIPGCVSISRKKDETWQQFLDQITPNTLTAILPEGRMKRKNGLDKNGEPMSIKPGVVDILKQITQGNILFVYSGGLHHIQSPGDKFPKIFKKVSVGLEILDVNKFKTQFIHQSKSEFTQQVIHDLSKKLAACDKL